MFKTSAESRLSSRMANVIAVIIKMAVFIWLLLLATLDEADNFLSRYYGNQYKHRRQIISKI